MLGIDSAATQNSTPKSGPDSSAEQGTILLKHPDHFVNRHIGPDNIEQLAMLKALGCANLDHLADTVVPQAIRSQRPLQLPAPLSERESLARLRTLSEKNQTFRSYIGAGFHDCITPSVIQRNVLENPGWYTPYTPYQAEISQGRLEGLLNFQTMVIDLTGMEIANASMLDEASAAAEAMTMCHAIKESEQRNRFFVSELCHPQIIDVVKTRANPLGIEVIVGDHASFVFDATICAALVGYPATNGEIFDYTGLVESAHGHGALVIVAADLLALTLLRPPAEFGADIVVGNSQRFGVPIGYGGPHAAFFATRDAFKRQMPGRLIGVSKDAAGKPAFRLSLQTREQHIRREKATSNICTAQALLANIAGFYAAYHGPQGLKQIAGRVHSLTSHLAKGIAGGGHRLLTRHFFDTIWVEPKGNAAEVHARARAKRINLRDVSSKIVGISLDETTTEADLRDLLEVFNGAVPGDTAAVQFSRLPDHMIRQSPGLKHDVFNRYHSETEMLRYLKRLENRDVGLTISMVPLGSCTMKLNAAAEMYPISFPGFSKLHPFAPFEQAQGYAELFRELEQWLAEITGFPAISLQPNAGSQGEYAGLLAIHDYHHHRGESHRNVCLIPQSAHGTNPASAVMAGMRVVPVACDKAGNIDLADLKIKTEAHQKDLSCLMITYPSTHGVFEASVREICSIVHAAGGQVYMDGANMNAQVGLCRPADIGADVCHLNLHKTFCIPHGGGGPGMGPIGVASHLAEFLPGHPLNISKGRKSGAVAAAMWGSASILPISWAYIAMMGAEGLTQATKVAILNANYIAKRLDPFFPVLYKGESGLVAHECILDLRHFKSVTVEDVAKRLMDYGFHAPTISWPVPGTMMIEPTESESKGELDRFCDALISIHREVTAIENGTADKLNNLLKNAPHSAEAVVRSDWNHPYSREEAAFPAPWTREQKYWPPVSRIDNVYGDRNLVCSCAGMENYS